MAKPPFNIHICRLLQPIEHQRPFVLDAGCGRSAALSLWLAEQGCVGVDLTLPLPYGQMVEIGDVPRGRLRLVKADLLTLDLSEQFDVVLLLGVLHCLDGPDRAASLLAKLARWARPEALLAASWLLDADPLLPQHKWAWFPDYKVDRLLVEARFHLVEDWVARFTHAHGGLRHSHRARYGRWIAE